jgi:hypothetical protein
MLRLDIWLLIDYLYVEANIMSARYCRLLHTLRCLAWALGLLDERFAPRVPAFQQAAVGTNSKKI